MKNLKGCLKFASKKRFHKRGHLLDLIAHLNMHIRSDLIVIDGTYAMERGPTMGTAHPMNIIIAGTDILETEMVGAAVLGKVPGDIPTIHAYGELTGRKTDLETVEIKGNSVESVAMDMPWQTVYNEAFKKFGMSGIQIASRSGDTSICSGCLGNMVYGNFMFCKDCPGLAVDKLDICIGQDSKPTADANSVILFGDCAIKNNSEDKRTIEIPGCPPDVGDYYPLLVKKNLSPGRATRVLITRLLKRTAYKMGLYHEDMGLWDPYRSPEFEQSFYE